ncbi:MAG: hypothetical protein IJ766_01160 [Clostridia bacterium]|nr:hypothetical protein [Clostridia bacterium]
MAEEFNSKVVLKDGTVLMDLTADTITADKLAQGVTAHDKSGAPITGTNTFDSDTSEDTAAVGEILSGKTAHARGVQLTGTMPNNGGINGTITTKEQELTIPQGYHDGSGKATIAEAEQAKIIPANIRQGVTVLGVEGEMSGSEDVNAQAKSVAPTFAEQSVTPDTDDGYNYLSAVTVAAIPVTYTDNAAGGKTVTIG